MEQNSTIGSAVAVAEPNPQADHPAFGSNRTAGGRPKKDSAWMKRVATRISRTLMLELRDANKLPAHVMIRNMIFWEDEATQIGEQLEALLKAAPHAERDAEGVLTSEGLEVNELRAMFAIVAKFLNAIKESQACAVDAANYFHPRQRAVEITGKDGGPIETVAKTMTPAQAMDAWQTILDSENG